MVSIKSENDNPYNELIMRFIAQSFPGTAVNETRETLENVMSALLASGQVRYGPAPDPESLVAIRAVVREAISKNVPIPMLMPFGSRKTLVHEPLDVAEVFTLKQISCLQERVTRFYSPGINLNIRMEDTSGNYMFRDEAPESTIATEWYVNAFINLVNIFSMHYVHPIRESDVFTYQAFADKTEEMLPAMVEYILETDSSTFFDTMPSWVRLRDLGWQGRIPAEQREYYRARYRVNYPGISDYGATKKLAEYLSGAWARVKLGGTGKDPAWKSFIKLTFVPPVPGAPESTTSTNLYYRTVHQKFAQTHLPAWRAKGYFKIGSDNSVVPKLSGWHEEREYEKNEIIIESGTRKVVVQADFIHE